MSGLASEMSQVSGGPGRSNVVDQATIPFNYEDFVPPKIECVGKLEPYLKNPLQLYGGQVKMQMQDIQWVMS